MVRCLSRWLGPSFSACSRRGEWSPGQSDIMQPSRATSRESEIASDVPFVPRGEPTTYRGRAIPYEFRLDPEWKTDEATTPDEVHEHSLAFLGGIGKIVVNAKAGGPISDFYSDALPESLRGAVETGVRQQVPGATVRLLGSRWVELNGIQWREISLEQGSGQASELKRVLYYSSPSGWIVVTIVLPNLDQHRTLADEIAGTFKAPESDLDRLLRKARRTSSLSIEARERSIPIVSERSGSRRISPRSWTSWAMRKRRSRRWASKGSKTHSTSAMAFRERQRRSRRRSDRLRKPERPRRRGPSGIAAGRRGGRTGVAQVRITSDGHEDPKARRTDLGRVEVPRFDEPRANTRLSSGSSSE